MRVAFHRSRFRRLVLLVRRSFSPAVALVQLLLLLLLLGQAARWTFKPDRRDDLRQADRLFQTGQYYAALRSYLSLWSHQQTPELALRLGIVRTVRGEYNLAERMLWSTLTSEVEGEAHDLAALYMGYVLDRRDDPQRAHTIWSWIPVTSRLHNYQHVLRAEQALQRGDYATAEVHYQAASDPSLLLAWQHVIHYRLALLHAASNPDAAHNELNNLAGRVTHSGQVARYSQPYEPLLVPLLPAPADEPWELLAVLQADPATRPQLLGQFYLDHNLFALAEAQFAQVAPDSPNARGAAAYAAYTRWRSGDTQGGLNRLEELVAAYPDDPPARTLLALVYISQDETTAARDQIDTVTTVAPTNPDTHLAWANWYTAQRDYVQASDEYRQVLRQAPPDQRGRYALLVARFHLNTTYELCERGLPAAEIAARELPTDAAAWTVLAASRYYCDDAAGAVEAAHTALRSNRSADAAFYLGVALADMGDRDAARSALVQAADLAPASVWRERAEARLAHLP